MKLVFVLLVIYSIFLKLYVLSFFSSIQYENKCGKNLFYCIMIFFFFTFLTRKNFFFFFDMYNDNE